MTAPMSGLKSFKPKQLNLCCNGNQLKRGGKLMYNLARPSLATIEKVESRGCGGGECDVDLCCKRHQRTYEIASRYQRFCFYVHHSASQKEHHHDAGHCIVVVKSGLNSGGKMTLRSLEVMVDRWDAPKGYYALPKESLRPIGVIPSSNRNENICKQCDWRKDCSSKHSCMSYSRADGIGVVFKEEKS